ncbi:hypothetical protein LC087_11690 [Bacillus carboniphilus]|uniref:Uncharacterized protein n=1 Tax=Bacillus carboniphilus TaxID=86663 RepID=A0ABY9JRW0_9BACI|nr:hypothetical protein [Bacillus carboniphilus]WLR41549.1 hypothetical protein LC087_11690 [Bacillus carboniphilus]
MVGLIDDKYTISAKAKFLGQIIAACFVVFSGFTIEFVTLPFSSEKIYLGIFSYILAVFLDCRYY